MDDLLVGKGDVWVREGKRNDGPQVEDIKKPASRERDRFPAV